jgi:hypothetical protein
VTTKYLLLTAAAALVPTAAWAAEGDAKETLESAGTGVRKPAASLMNTGIARARTPRQRHVNVNLHARRRGDREARAALAGQIVRAIPGERTESTTAKDSPTSRSPACRSLRA